MGKKKIEEEEEGNPDVVEKYLVEEVGNSFRKELEKKNFGKKSEVILLE